MDNLEQIKSLLEKITGMSAFSERQTDYITVWVNDWDMSAEDIVSAYHATLDRCGKVDFRYWNAVLKKRYEDKLLKRSVNAMIFHDEHHETAYNDICSRMKYLDCYHRSLAYLLTLDSVLREHIDDVYNLKADSIKLDGLHKPWQTGTSKKTTRLAFNLWNGCHDDGETYTDNDGYEADLPSRYYAPDEIFSSVYAPYYWQAIQIRFEMNI